MFSWKKFALPSPNVRSVMEAVYQANRRLGPAMCCRKLKAFVCMKKSSDNETDSSETLSSDEDDAVRKRLIVRDQPGEEIDQTEASTKRLTERTAHSGVYLSRFLYGLFLMQILQLLISYQTTWKPIQTTVFFAAIGFSVGCGMAFSKAIRAIATLVVPVMCTSSGRAVLMSYTSMMVLAGPVSNIAYNYGEISRSMLCGNELGFNITQGLQPMIQEKKFQFLDSLDNSIDVVLSAVEAVQDTYEKVAEAFQVVADNIKMADYYIKSAIVICDAESSSFMCNLPGDAARKISRVITKPFSNALAKIRNLFFFDVHFEHEFTYKVRMNKTLKEIEQKILSEVKARFGYVTNVLDLTRFVASFSTIIVIFKATVYRKKYLTNNEFDNTFITGQFKHLDRKAEKHGKAVILPLRYRESKLYISPTKCCMSRAELKKCFRGWMLVSANMFLSLFIMATDTTLYTAMKSLSLSLSLRSTTLIDDFVDASKKTTFIGKASDVMGAFITLNVFGKGLVAAIYRAVIEALQNVTKEQGYDINIDKCLPKPSIPNYFTYVIIFCIMQICYTLVYIQAYMLRLRRYIMSRYYPERERQRVTFLRKKILNNRGIGHVEDLKRTIRKAANEVEKNQSKKKLSCWSSLRKWSNRRGIRGTIARFITRRTAHSCNLCRFSGSRSEGSSFTKCQRMGCSIEYCIPCFDDLHRICPVCLMRHSKKAQKIRRLSKTLSFKEIAERENAGGIDDTSSDFVPSSGISDSSEEESAVDVTAKFS